jgi:iron complex outermembrane receptor protein
MKTPCLVRSLWPALLAAFLATAAALIGAAADVPATGKIVGRVFNPVSQEYVRNAEVRLEGTSQTAYTESDGSFSFPSVPPGHSTLSVAFSGYQPVREIVTVGAGQTAVREINLQSVTTSKSAPGEDVTRLATYTVSSEREGNAKAIMSQRKNMDITTSVSSDIFGEIPDGNVGEFLKYLPGVDIDYVQSEARGPRLGALGGQYVGVTVDGARLASADAFRTGDLSRATSFEALSIAPRAPTPTPTRRPVRST